VAEIGIGVRASFDGSPAIQGIRKLTNALDEVRPRSIVVGSQETERATAGAGGSPFTAANPFADALKNFADTQKQNFVAVNALLTALKDHARRGAAPASGQEEAAQQQQTPAPLTEAPLASPRSLRPNSARRGAAPASGQEEAAQQQQTPAPLTRSLISVQKRLVTEIKALATALKNTRGTNPAEAPPAPRSGNRSRPAAEDDGAAGKLLKGISTGVIAKTIAGQIGRGVTMYAGFENRSGMFGNALSGNYAGAGGDTLRKAGEKQGFWGGNIAGGIGLAAGTALGGPLVGMAAGGILKSLTETILKSTAETEANKIETRSTLAGGYMAGYNTYRDTGQLLGGLTSQDTFGKTRSGERFGIGSQEYAGLLGNLSKATGEANPDFVSTRLTAALEASRSTGASRESMLELSGSFGRYGGDRSAVFNAYSGNQAMGGNNATLEEYSRAMTKVFRDGISQGFVRGNETISKQISGVSNFLTNASGGANAAYTNSENTAGFITGINQSIAGSAQLGNASQAMMFRTVGGMVNGKETGAKIDGILQKQLGIDPKKISNAEKTRIISESGLQNPEIMKAVIEQIKARGGDSNYQSHLVQSTFGVGAYQARLMLNGNGADLGKGIANQTLPTRATEDGDTFQAKQTAMQNDVIAKGLGALPKAIDDMAYVAEKLREQFEALNLALPTLTHEIRSMSADQDRINNETRKLLGF
jgi:hypothetical protein